MHANCFISSVAMVTNSRRGTNKNTKIKYISKNSDYFYFPYSLGKGSVAFSQNLRYRKKRSPVLDGLTRFLRKVATAIF